VDAVLLQRLLERGRAPVQGGHIGHNDHLAPGEAIGPPCAAIQGHVLQLLPQRLYTGRAPFVCVAAGAALLIHHEQVGSPRVQQRADLRQ